MPVIRLILADQLSETVATLRDVDKQRDTIMLCE